MHNFSSMELIFITATGVFLGVAFSEVVFSALQIILGGSEEDDE